MGEYASLLPVSGDLMPDAIDGLDESQSQLEQSHKDEDEFLPSEVESQSKSLERLEDDQESDDEFTASLMAAAKDVAQEIEESPKIRHRKATPEDDNSDDFEMISEAELAEVSP